MSEQYLYEGEVPPPGIASSAEYKGPNAERGKVEVQPKANIVVLEQDTFHEFIFKADKPVLVDFWALWCAPCTRMIPVFEELADERPDIYVAKVNVDNAKALAGEYSIMTIPTMILFKDGEPVASCSGTMEKEDIIAGIDPFLK